MVSRLYRAHFLTFAAIALAVVLPLEVITLGLVDGYLTSGYSAEDLVGAGVLAYTVTYRLVMVPLITAGHVHAVMDIGSLGTLLGLIALIIPAAT